MRRILALALLLSVTSAAAQMLPDRLRRMTELRDYFPRNAAGKTLKRERREPYWAGRERRI